VGRIGGGTSVNSIPFESWMEFDMRSEQEDTLIALEREFLKFVNLGIEEENRFRAASGTTLKVDPKRVAIRHAVASAVNQDLVAAAKWSSEALGLGVPGMYIGSTDSNTPLALGIPAITIDGGGKAGSLHSLEEWFEPEGAYTSIQKALLTILKYDEIAKPQLP
jgi:acetylornithine deacetylase/succinyl-diaminopimelate desuccinylase-like protein